MSDYLSGKTLKKRRTITAVLLVLLVALIQLLSFGQNKPPETTQVLSQSTQNSQKALEALENLEVKGRAPKTNYKRAEFGDGWARVGDCDLRNIMLRRYLDEARIGTDDCIVLSGVLQDFYTGKTINFVRGSSTSGEVQIDHVVALSDAWQKGAQNIAYEQRIAFANDPLNLLPVDGQANQNKGDSDAASWLPSNKSFRCQYIARQIAVKQKYKLWITEAEKAAMKRQLNSCTELVLPIEK